MKSEVKKQLTRKQLLEKIRSHKSGDAPLDLRGVRLWRAKLNNTYLRGADLQEAILEGADLMRANLRGANLKGTNLINTDLRGASLEGAILEGAKMVILKGHLRFTFTAKKLVDLLPSLALDPSRTKYYGAKKKLVIVTIKKLSDDQYCFKTI